MCSRQLLLLTISLVVSPCLCLAQSDTATISGRITDPTGLVLEDVRVRAASVETSVETPTLSNADGIYVVRNLRAGLYRLVVEKEGYKTIVLDGLTLAVQDVLGRNFTMEVGPIKDTVTVTASREERNLSASVSTVVNRQFVENMPLNGRSFQSLILLTPGVLVTSAGQNMEGQFSTSAQRTNTNYFTVDGVSANFAAPISVNQGQSFGGSLPALTIGGGTNSFVSVDAMQEFRTQTSTYSPEFGRTPGAQIAIVTKSGTNVLHGTVYDYLRNEAFDARNWYNQPPEPKPPLRQQNFGGTVGGPVRRNRSFFFASYEGLRLEQPQVLTAYFYTPETRASVAPVYRPIVDAMPIPNGPLQSPACDNVSSPCLASLTLSLSNSTRFDASSLRFDHAFSQRFTLFARAGHTPSVTRLVAPLGGESDSRNTDLATVGMTAILRTSLINDLRVNWSRSSARADVTLGDAYGAVTPANLGQVSVFLPSRQLISERTRAANAEEQINIVDTFSTVAGRHYLKFGFDYRRIQPTNYAGEGNIVVVNSFNELRAGTMSLILSTATESITARMHNASIFGQDTWTATPRLTLTYGIRWELNSPPASLTSGRPLYAIEGIFDSNPLGLAPPGTPLWRTRYGNVAPRLGAAYQVSSSTIVRGGAGLFHDLGYGGLLGDLVFGFPYYRNATINAAGQPFDPVSPLVQRLPFTTTVSGAGSLVAFDPNLQLPATRQWNATVEQSLGAHQMLTVSYVGADGRRLLRPDVIVPAATGLVAGPRVRATRNAGQSRYAALQVQVQRRLNRGLQALGSYTLASARDTESDDLGGNFNGASLNANYAASVSQVHVPSLSPADFDVRHAFSAAVSYEVPTPNLGRTGRAILGGWGVDAIVRSSSPPPLNVRIEGVSPEFGVYRTQPDLVPGQPIWIAAPEQPGGKALNPDAFTVPPWGVPGNLPRNSIRSPFGINQTDLALRRRLPLTTGTSLEFRADVFNLFNNPMFGGPAAPQTFWGRCSATPCAGKQNPTFGTVAEGMTLNNGLGGAPLEGGQNALYGIGGPRSIQFSLKVRF